MFDFTGTGPEIYGNLNAPPAGRIRFSCMSDVRNVKYRLVTTSAIIYCLRCLLPEISDIPLNQVQEKAKHIFLE